MKFQVSSKSPACQAQRRQKVHRIHQRNVDKRRLQYSARAIKPEEGFVRPQAPHVSGGHETQPQPWAPILTDRRVGSGLGGGRFVSFVMQLLASLLSIMLFIWSTYDAATPGSLRHLMDLGLCCFFATELGFRVSP